MLFILKNKDRYGVWCSTQTTINVLDTFLLTMANEDGAGRKVQEITVSVNGENQKS